MMRELTEMMTHDIDRVDLRQHLTVKFSKKSNRPVIRKEPQLLEVLLRMQEIVLLKVGGKHGRRHNPRVFDNRLRLDHVDRIHVDIPLEVAVPQDRRKLGAVRRERRHGSCPIRVEMSHPDHRNRVCYRDGWLNSWKWRRATAHDDG